jgi:hypothetical protein
MFWAVCGVTYAADIIFLQLNLVVQYLSAAQISTPCKGGVDFCEA